MLTSFLVVPEHAGTGTSQTHSTPSSLPVQLLSKYVPPATDDGAQVAV
jgi:hypothetical protein